MADQKMNKYAVRKEIAALIDSIKSHSDTIGTRKHIPQLELELILHKIEKLYQKSIVFNYLNSIDGGEGFAQDEIQPPVVKTEEQKTPVPPPPIQQEEVKPAAEIKVPEIKTEVPPPVVPQPEQKEEPKPAEEIKVPEVKIPLPPVQPPVQQPEPPKTETPPAKKYPDIKTFVGFNEKIMFIRQLFGGDAAAYDEAVKQLNACGSYDEAAAFVSLLKTEFKWKTGDEATDAFNHIVKRRFT